MNHLSGSHSHLDSFFSLGKKSFKSTAPISSVLDKSCMTRVGLEADSWAPRSLIAPHSAPREPRGLTASQTALGRREKPELCSQATGRRAHLPLAGICLGDPAW